MLVDFAGVVEVRADSGEIRVSCNELANISLNVAVSCKIFPALRSDVQLMAPKISVASPGCCSAAARMAAWSVNTCVHHPDEVARGKTKENLK